MRIFILVSAFLLATNCWAEPCEGNVRLFVTENAETHFNERQTTVLLPARLQLSPALANCANQIYFKPLVGNDYQLDNQSRSVKLSFHDASRIPLIRKPFQGQLLFSTKIDGRTIIPLNLMLGSSGLIAPGIFGNAFEVVVETKDNEIVSFTDSIEYFSPSLLAIDVTSNDPKVVGSSRYFSIKMGELKTGSQASWDINILANGPYNIKVRSEHGKLEHASRAGSYIDYTLEIDDRKYSPKQEIITTFNQPEGFENIVSFELNVGNTDFKRAGLYEDELTVTVSAY